MTTSGRHRSARRSVCCVALLLLTGPLSACGEDDPSPGGDDQPSASVPATGSPSEVTPSETAGSGGSPEPTESTGSTGSTENTPTSPVVEPASGPLLKLDQSTVHAPAGWELGSDLGFAVAADDPAPGSVNSVFMANGPNLARGDLDRMVKAYLDSVTTDLLPTRQPDTLLAGQPAYFLMGPVDKDRSTFVYGAANGGADAQLIIDLDRTMPADQQQAVVASVLASFEWR